MSGEPEPLVLKFGGASFASPGAHRVIARHVASRRGGRSSARVVVVVSAVAGETDRLSAQMRAVSPDPDRELLAAALMSGETVNVTLMTAALRDAGLAAHALTAADTGFVGMGEPHHADLVEINATALRKAAEPGGVVVVPGGQAVGPHGRPVMLGRNSSDLSAIAAAAALGAPGCEIFSDSPGICTADPQLIPDARTLARIDYDTMMAMSRHGAKVLHHSAVVWAARHGVEIRCRSLLPDGRRHSVVGAADGAAGARRVGAVVVHRTGAVWTGEVGRVRALRVDPTRLGPDVVMVDGTVAGGVVEGAVVGGLAAGTGAAGTGAAGIVSAGTTVEGSGSGVGVAHLVLADALRDLASDGLRRTDLRLVTTMFPDGRLDLRLVPPSEVTAVARAQHRLVIGD
ncbi:aspartate kinase [Frankia canadensis]|nr:aspartate kinase [Frankia canadensis]